MQKKKQLSYTKH